MMVRTRRLRAPSNFPDELVSEVFLRLPFPVFVRISRLSKRWHSFVKETAGLDPFDARLEEKLPRFYLRDVYFVAWSKHDKRLWIYDPSATLINRWRWSIHLPTLTGNLKIVSTAGGRVAFYNRQLRRYVACNPFAGPNNRQIQTYPQATCPFSLRDVFSKLLLEVHNQRKLTVHELNVTSRRNFPWNTLVNNWPEDKFTNLRDMMQNWLQMGTHICALSDQDDDGGCMLEKVDLLPANPLQQYRILNTVHFDHGFIPEMVTPLHRLIDCGGRLGLAALVIASNPPRRYAIGVWLLPQGDSTEFERLGLLEHISIDLYMALSWPGGMRDNDFGYLENGTQLGSVQTQTWFGIGDYVVFTPWLGNLADRLSLPGIGFSFQISTRTWSMIPHPQQHALQHPVELFPLQPALYQSDYGDF